MDAARKRGRPDAINGGGGEFKRPRETDSFQPGLGSKSKPCIKFFSTSGCPFGEGCHFLHFVPGGLHAVSKMNIGNPVMGAPASNPIARPAINDGLAAPVVKSRICNKYDTMEGCKFGDRCRFAHGEKELGRPVLSSHNGPLAPALGGRGISGRFEPPPPAGMQAADSFGASATAKISVDASLAGVIIGKGGVNTKQICRVTGVRLTIKEHESNPNLKNIELEGSFDQINQASAMVRELIFNVSSSAPPPMRNPLSAPSTDPRNSSFVALAAAPGSNFKTKLCENFAKGSCSFGDRCHFAHGENELRKTIGA